MLMSLFVILLEILLMTTPDADQEITKSQWETLIDENIKRLQREIRIKEDQKDKLLQRQDKLIAEKERYTAQKAKFADDYARKFQLKQKLVNENELSIEELRELQMFYYNYE